MKGLAVGDSMGERSRPQDPMNDELGGEGEARKGRELTIRLDVGNDAEVFTKKIVLRTSLSLIIPQTRIKFMA